MGGGEGEQPETPNSALSPLGSRRLWCSSHEPLQLVRETLVWEAGLRSRAQCRSLWEGEAQGQSSGLGVGGATH